MSEVFTFKTEVKCEDCNGVPFAEGSVVRSTEEDCRGVIQQIVRPGTFTMFAERVGDLRIFVSPGIYRVTNRYSKWEHIPREEQTYYERYLSWLHGPQFESFNESVSDDEYRAIQGVMALFPQDPIDYDWGPFADRIEEALELLAKHMDEKGPVSKTT